MYISAKICLSSDPSIFKKTIPCGIPSLPVLKGILKTITVGWLYQFHLKMFLSLQQCNYFGVVNHSVPILQYVNFCFVELACPNSEFELLCFSYLGQLLSNHREQATTFVTDKASFTNTFRFVILNKSSLLGFLSVNRIKISQYKDYCFV